MNLQGRIQDALNGENKEHISKQMGDAVKTVLEKAQTNLETVREDMAKTRELPKTFGDVSLDPLDFYSN